MRMLAVLPLLLVALLRGQVPSPTQFLGHEVGADYQLCNYTDLVRYFRAVESASDRVKVVGIGPTSYGQQMVMAVVTAKENHARLERLRAISGTLCRAEPSDETNAAALVEEGRAVVWIDAGLHATEAIAGQNIIELLWRMASRDDAEVRRILDEVVLLICPVNPDGLELVANAYRATRSMAIPVLYQRYIGHDNNRDFYTANQLEAQAISRVFFHEWFPQIVYNHHQPAPSGTILYTPPFRDPFNYNVEPLVMRGIEVVSAHMNHRFSAEGKPGIISRSGAPYSMWWNGGLRTSTCFHNMIGILTEAFGKPEPTRLVQSLERRLTTGDYPDPVPTQLWHARQTVEYLQTANFAILDYAARYRRELLTNIWRMGRWAIEKGSRDHWTPTAKLAELAKDTAGADRVFADPSLRDAKYYVLSRAQADWSAVLRFVRALRRNGIDVQRADTALACGDVQVPAGSFVVATSQPFRAHVVDMLEPQWYPQDIQNGKPVPPYDSAGWTLAMQMGVYVLRLHDAPVGKLSPYPNVEAWPTNEAALVAGTWRLDARDSHTVAVVCALLQAGVAVEWSGAGAFQAQIGASSLATVAEIVRKHPMVPQVLASDAFGAGKRLKLPRVGLFDAFGGHMGTGWAQWMLGEFGVPLRQVWGDRIDAGGLQDEFDVLIFHSGLPGGRDLQRSMREREKPDLGKLAEALPPFEDWRNLASRNHGLTAKDSLPKLREFVAAGGTLIALPGECEKLVRHFDLPVEVGTFVNGEQSERRKTLRSEFYVPGSLLALEVDPSHPLARGSAPMLATLFRNECEVLTPLDASVQVVAKYRSKDCLLSGWAIGTEYLADKAAVAVVRVGAGRIVLFGCDAIYRGQPLTTARMVFHAVLTSTER